MTEQERAFKGVWIPADIWLSKELTISEKIILTEIQSFCDHYQSCFASNEHFAELLQVGERRIQKVLKTLEAKGVIERELVYKKGTKEIEKRFLRVREGWCPSGRYPHVQVDVPPHDQKFADNIPSMNNTSNSNIYGQNAKNKQTKKKVFVPPTLEEVEAHINEKGFHFNAKEFIDYYEASDWHRKDGKKVSNWRQCCVTWESNAKKHGETNKVSNSASPSGIRTNVDWGAYDGL